MTNAMNRPALLDSADTTGAGQTADQPHCTDRSAWDAADAKLQAEMARDQVIDARYKAAKADGTLTPEFEREWSDSTLPLSDAEWALFETDAPDLAAIDWKLQFLADHHLLEEQHVSQLRADIARLSSVEGR